MCRCITSAPRPNLHSLNPGRQTACGTTMLSGWTRRVHRRFHGRKRVRRLSRGRHRAFLRRSARRNAAQGPYPVHLRRRELLHRRRRPTWTWMQLVVGRRPPSRQPRRAAILPLLEKPRRKDRLRALFQAPRSQLVPLNAGRWTRTCQCRRARHSSALHQHPLLSRCSPLEELPPDQLVHRQRQHQCCRSSRQHQQLRLRRSSRWSTTY